MCCSLVFHVALAEPCREYECVSLQGRSFASLPNLRELRLEAENTQRTYAGIVTVDLAGLPAGLQSLEVRQQFWRHADVNAWLSRNDG